MKKVLFTATVDSHITQFHLHFLKYFKDNNYEVHVATNGEDSIPYCDKKHVVCFERSPFKIRNLKAIKQLKKICEEEKFDIIHTHTPMGSVVTRIAAMKSRKIFNTRVMYTAHGFHFYKKAPLINWLLFYPVEKILAKDTDTIITINKEDFDLAKKKFSKRCHDIHYVPGVGIDESKFNFKFSAKDNKEIRNSLGLNENDFIMIYPAELSKRKRQIWLINTLSDFIKKNSNVHLLLPGKDSLNGKCQRIVEEKGLSSQIHFLGYRNDIPKLLKISNLALSSANQEGLPVNVMEAMYVGLPIVGTDCRGNRDLIKDNINGYLIQLNDNNRFASCVEKLYLIKNDNFSNKSRQIVKDYMLDLVLEKMEKIYNKKIKILHLLSSSSYSGAENLACKIIDVMKDNYDFIYCSPKGEIENILKKKSIIYESIKQINKREVKKIVNRIKPDIIHAHDFKASIIAGLFKKNTKIISHIHKNDPKMKKISFKSIVYSLFIHRFRLIVGVSESIYNEFYFSKFMKDKFVFVPNYIDKEDVINKSKEYSIEKEYDLLYLGRLSEEKNPIEFINVVKMLNNSKIKCVMIGDGPLKNECIQKIKYLDLEDNIEMVGFLENPFPYLIKCKICIMPSEFEGFGISAIEATILDIPVLNSGVGGLENIFKNDDYLICKNTKDYIEKTTSILKGGHKVDKSIIKKYCDVCSFQNNLKSIYNKVI